MPPDAAPTILAVDDEESLREVLAAALALDGYQVVTVGTAPEALAWLTACWPAALVLDVCMPRMTGVDLLTALRLQAGRVPPTVLITGYAQEGMTTDITAEVEALVAPARAVTLTKPFSLDELAAALAAVLAAEVPP